MTEWSIAQITFTLADGSDESFLLGKGKLGTEEMLEGKQFTIITNRVKNRWNCLFPHHLHHHHHRHNYNLYMYVRYSNCGEKETRKCLMYTFRFCWFSWIFFGLWEIFALNLMKFILIIVNCILCFDFFRVNSLYCQYCICFILKNWTLTVFACGKNIFIILNLFLGGENDVFVSVSKWISRENNVNIHWIQQLNID